ncbi:hypothetical protein Tco_1168042 [Tanacetum coccineum]
MRYGSGLSKGLCLICVSRYENNLNSLNDSPNIFKNVSQSPPLIDHHCCYGCGDSLDDIFCQRCTCESCGNGAHYGYNCPPQVPIISNPEPCNNQTIDESPQTLPSFHLTCYSGDENSFTYDSNLNFVDDSPNPPPQPPTYSYEFCGDNAHYGHDCPPQVPFIYNPEPCYNQDFNFLQNFQSFHQQYLCCTRCGGPHETFQCDQLIFDEPYSENYGGPHATFQCHLMNQNYYGPNPCYDYNSFSFDQVQPPQFPIIHQPPQEASVEMLQARENLMISIETFLKKFNRISFRETPKVLLLAWEKFFEIKHACNGKQHQPEDTQELIRKLLKDVKNMNEELAEYINSPSWNRPAFYFDDDEDDTIAITHVLPTVELDNSLSMGGEHLSTIPEKEEISVEDLIPIPSESEGIPDNMCDASPVDFELVSLEVMEIVIPKVGGIDTDILLAIKDDILHEKLLNVNLLISNIEALKDNLALSFDFVTKSPSTSSNFFLEETNTFDNSLPESKTFCFNLEEISSGSTTTRSDYSLPDYEAFYFDDNHIK